MTLQRTNKRLTSVHVIAMSLLIMMSGFMIYYADRQSFWQDELRFTIQYFHNTSFFQMLKALAKEPYNLPLYYIMLHPYYQVVPYGEMWLLLPSVFFAVVGTMITGKIGDALAGKSAGLFTIALGAISSVLMYHGGWEFRPYSLMFLCSSLTLYSHYKKRTTKRIWSSLLYAISLVLLMYTHWFGVLLAALYGLFDLYQIVRKNEDKRILVPYVIAVACFLPWGILLLKYRTIPFRTYWPDIPSPSRVVDLIKYLLDDNAIKFHIFLIGVVMVLVRHQKHDSSHEERRFTGSYSLLIYCVVAAISVIYVYSAFVNPEGSFYVYRYFLVILPHIFLIMSVGLCGLQEFELKLNGEKVDIAVNRVPIDGRLIGAILCIFLIMAGVQSYEKGYRLMISPREPYREIAQYCTSAEPSSANSLILTDEAEQTGWISYYIEKRGLELPANMGTIVLNQVRMTVENGKWVREERMLNDDQFLQFSTLYLLQPHTKISESSMGYINQYYQEKSYDEKLKITIYERKIDVET